MIWLIPELLSARKNMAELVPMLHVAVQLFVLFVIARLETFCQTGADRLSVYSMTGVVTTQLVAIVNCAVLPVTEKPEIYKPCISAKIDKATLPAGPICQTDPVLTLRISPPL